MTEEDRWGKVRQIVREECERIEQRILAVLEKHGQVATIQFVEGKWRGITKAHMDAWQSAFGAVDLNAELAKAAAWLVSNPSRMPKNFARFLYKWLEKPQNSASIRSIPTRNEKPRICAYCGAPSVGSTNAREHCREHAQAAMEDRKPMSVVK